MEKNSFISNFKKLPFSFLIAIIIVLIFEYCNTSFDNYFYNPDPENVLPFEGLRIKLKNEISQSPRYNFDIIIIGDSHGHVAFKPNLIEAKTGLSCFNFSLFGRQGILGPYLILQNYLRTHSTKPKYLVISIYFANLGFSKRQFKKNVLTYFSDFKKGNIITLIKELDLGIGAIKLLIPSLKHQNRIKTFIENPFSFRLPNKIVINNFIQQVYSDKGYYPYRVNTYMQAPPPEFEYPNFFKNHNLNEFPIDAPTYNYLKSILDMAMNNNIKVIYYITPVHYSFYKKLKKGGYIEKYHQFVNSLKKNYPGLIVFDPQNSHFDAHLYVNTSHFNKRGAELMSSLLSDKINEIENNIK